MECNWESPEPQFEVNHGLEVRGLPDNILGKPRKDKFHTAPWVWLAHLCRQNHVLTRATVSAALLGCLFLPHNCEWSDQAARYTQKK